jgi:hypothetical protein
LGNLIKAEEFVLQMVVMYDLLLYEGGAKAVFGFAAEDEVKRQRAD